MPETDKYSETAIHEWTDELFLEKGDRTNWYKLTIYFENDTPKEYDFYSYDDSLTKEFILNDRFYVNDHELLIMDEAGEHYINRRNINQIDFLQRKLFVDSSVSESQTKEPEQSTDFFEIEEIHDFEQQIPVSHVAETRVELEEALSEEKPKKKIFSKVKKIKRPTVKKMKSKTFNQLFLIAIVFVLASGMIALIRTIMFDGRINQLESGQKEMMASDSRMEKTTVAQYPYEMNLFMQTFIEYYIPLSNDSSSMDERVETLNTFFSEEVSLDREISMVKRTLISSELANVVHKDVYSTAYYKVIYSLEIPVEQTREQEGTGVVETFVEYQKKQYTSFLSIDFIQQDRSFSIISYPYFSEQLVSHLEDAGVRKKEDANLAVDGEKLEEVKRFLTIFFEKYASGSKEELSYLMDEVEAMGGNYQLVEIESVEAYFRENSIIVYTQVQFNEKDSGLLHKEAFSIMLVEETNQFRAHKLVHNLGGL